MSQLGQKIPIVVLADVSEALGWTKTPCSLGPCMPAELRLRGGAGQEQAAVVEESKVISALMRKQH